MSRLNRSWPLRSAFWVVAIACAFTACSDAETEPSSPAKPQSSPTSNTDAPTPPPPSSPTQTEPSPVPDDPGALTDRGRAVYVANCIACHSTEPGFDGAIGPAIAGSSLELLEARIMRNEYPEGYKPKRDTKAMIALPYLEKDLAALAAFLAE